MKISHFLLGLACLVLAVSCKKNPSLAERLQKADQAELKFTHPEEMSPIGFLEGAELVALRGILQGDTTPIMKCGDMGHITFLTGNDTITQVWINLDEGCKVVTYMEDDQLVSRWLQGKAAMVLDSVYQFLTAPQGLSDLKWMLGSWTQTEGDAVSFENWDLMSDDHFVGHAYTMVGKDTVFQEQLEIIKEGEDIYYVATVSENEGPVRFKLTTSEEGVVIFENKAHDFPQMIDYRAVGDSGINARISGMQNGQYGAKDFPLRRVK